MLRRKMFRDIKNNLSQFITIFLMVFIGILAYTGIESYMMGMQKTADKFYKENNLQDLNVISADFTTKDLDDIYFSIATLKYLPSSILSRLEVHEPKKKVLTLSKKDSKGGSGILIAGSSDILCSLATCCNPVYGEDIVGYITRGYGVKIHSKNCPNIDLNSERIIDAEWENNTDNRYTAKLKVYIDDVSDILLKIITLSTKDSIIVDSINLINRNKELFYDISCRVKNINDLHLFIDEVKAINSVTKVERVFI